MLKHTLILANKTVQRIVMHCVRLGVLMWTKKIASFLLYYSLKWQRVQQKWSLSIKVVVQKSLVW